MTSTTISLKEHIEQTNLKMKEAGWTCSIETDLSYWTERGITTTEQYIHMDLSTEHYERYSEIYGIKPRWYNYDEMSIEQLEFALKDLQKSSERMEEDRKANELHEKLRVQEMNERNSYKPNLAFADLKDMIGK